MLIIYHLYYLINELIFLNRINEIGLIIVDELHMLADKDRGWNLVVLLTKIKIFIQKLKINNYQYYFE